jgi:hypothetical protein
MTTSAYSSPIVTTALDELEAEARVHVARGEEVQFIFAGPISALLNGILCCD